jgi:hypothetical protein
MENFYLCLRYSFCPAIIPFVIYEKEFTMPKSVYPIALILVILAVLLVACGGKADSGAVRAVEDYLNALINKDDTRISSLSCADWEMMALLELDSFQAVETRLEGLSCSEVGTDGDTLLVNCQGKIIATYNDEDQELDLSLRTYQVVKQGGEYLVCGYR